jgi:hypothetical protein
MSSIKKTGFDKTHTNSEQRHDIIHENTERYGALHGWREISRTHDIFK